MFDFNAFTQDQGLGNALRRHAGMIPPSPIPRPMMPANQEQSPSFFARMRPILGNNSNALMMSGAALMSGGFDDLPAGLMAGMQLDGQARDRREDRQQAQQSQNATLALLQQYNPQMSEQEAMHHIQAGSAGELINQALRPAETFRPLSVQEAAQMGLPENARFQVGPDGRVHQIGGGGTTINNNMGGGTGVGLEAFIESSVDIATAEIEAGNLAARAAIQIDDLERYLQTAPQGAVGALTSFANNLGIPFEGSDEVGAAEAIISQLVPAQRPPGSGPMSDADLELFKRGLVRIINQPGANQLILQGMRALNQYDQARGRIAAEYRQNTVSGMHEAEALWIYNQQMSELNASTPSLQSIVAGSGISAPTASSGHRFSTGADGVMEYR